MPWARVSTGISSLLANSPAARATITGPGRLTAPNGDRSAAVMSVCIDPRVQVRLMRMPHSPAETVRAAELTRSPIAPASRGSPGAGSPDTSAVTVILASLRHAIFDRIYCSYSI
jgi:hypothetical protein